MKRPGCVLFDLDGTLVHYDHATRVETLARRVGTTAERVEAELFASGLEQETDLGLHDAQGQADALARRLGVPVSLGDCIAARASSMAPDAEVVALAREAARHAKIAILTNNGLLVRDQLAALCAPLGELFADRVFCSAEFGIGKPDPAIYLQCAQRLGLKPASILFVDDKRENADAARTAGLQAHHHTDAAELRAALQAHGLLEDTADRSCRAN